MTDTAVEQQQQHVYFLLAVELSRSTVRTQLYRHVIELCLSLYSFMWVLRVEIVSIAAV